jgi:hypothetical protein
MKGKRKDEKKINRTRKEKSENKKESKRKTEGTM